MEGPGSSKVTSKFRGRFAGALSHCETLMRRDKIAERERRKFGGLGIGFGLATFVSIFLLQISPMVGMGTAVFAIIMIVGIVGYVRNNRLDVEDRKLEIVHTLLSTLGPEIAAKRAITLDFDLRGYDQLGTGGSEPNWLTLDFVLDDQSRIRFQVSQFHKRKTRAKRKYTKIKDKVVERVLVRIIPAGDRSLGDIEAQRFERSLVPIPGLELRAAQLRGRAACLTWSTAPEVHVRGRSGWVRQGHVRRALTPNQAVMAVASAYRGLGQTVQRDAA